MSVLPGGVVTVVATVVGVVGVVGVNLPPTVVDINITGLSVLVCLVHILYVQACIAILAILL